MVTINDTVTVEKDLRDNTCRVDLELLPDEYRAIGKCTAQWGYLEHAMLMFTVRLCKSAKIAFPDQADSLSFTKRLRALRLVVQETVTDQADRKRFLALCSKIGNAEGERHKISHGLWDFSSKSGVRRLIASSFRKRHEFELNIDQRRLEILASRIAALNFDLTFPGGEDEAWMSALDPSPSTFELTVPKKKARQRPRRHPTSPQGGTPRRSSSRR